MFKKLGWVFNVTDIEKCIFEPMFKATKAAVIEVNSDRIAIFRCLYRNNRSLNASYWTYSCIPKLMSSRAAYKMLI